MTSPSSRKADLIEIVTKVNAAIELAKPNATTVTAHFTPSQVNLLLERLLAKKDDLLVQPIIKKLEDALAQVALKKQQ